MDASWIRVLRYTPPLELIGDGSFLMESLLGPERIWTIIEFLTLKVLLAVLAVGIGALF